MSIYHSSILDLLEKMAPEHEVCQDGKRNLLNKDLLEQSIKIASYLSSKGLKRGDHVLFAVAPGIEFLVLFVSLIHLRVKIALIDPHMGPQLYAAKIKQLSPKWAFIDRRLLFLQEFKFIKFLYRLTTENGLFIPGDTSYVTFCTGPRMPLMRKYEQIKNNKDSLDVSPSSQDDEIVIVYTAGTLDEPKGVVHSINTIYEGLKLLSGILSSNEKQKSMVSHLPHFALIGMITGYKTHFWKENLSVANRFRFIRKHQITTLFGPPSEFLEMIKFCRKKRINFPSSLNHLILGSAPVLKKFIKELKQYYTGRISCLYGMTEHVVNSVIDGDQKLAIDADHDILGIPHPTMKYYIADDSELMINSPALFKRYLHEDTRPEYYPTGDLVTQNNEGYVIMKGRKKNMIIRRNKNIYPALYESTITSIPGVRDACLIGIYNHKKHDEDVFLIVEVDEKMSAETIRKRIKQGKNAIDSDAQPDHILFMKIPRSGRQQKVNYIYLREYLGGLIA